MSNLVNVSQFSNTLSERCSSSSYNIMKIEWLKDFVAGDYNLEMNPEFQRNIVWTDVQCSNYVEALLKERKVNVDVYFNYGFIENGIKYPSFCVDGLQRITALERFKNDEITVFGYKASELSGLNSLKYSLTVHLNHLESYIDVLDWYLELNDTGVAHTKEELDRVREMINHIKDGN